MATKDWKKIDIETGEFFRYRNKKKNVDLVAMKHSQGRYEIYLYGSRLNNMGEEHLRYVNNQKQALKFAKSYMRKH